MAAARSTVGSTISRPMTRGVVGVIPLDSQEYVTAFRTTVQQDWSQVMEPLLNPQLSLQMAGLLPGMQICVTPTGSLSRLLLDL